MKHRDSRLERTARQNALRAGRPRVPREAVPDLEPPKDRADAVKGGVRRVK